MKLSRILKNNSGFSLLELLIYMAILSGFLMVIVNLFFSILGSAAREEARKEVQQNLQFAIQQISDDIRHQDNITSINANGDILDLSSGADPNKITLRFDASINILKKIQGDAGASSCDGTDSKCKADCATLDPNCKEESITSSKVSIGQSSPLNPIFRQIENTIQIILTISYNDNGRRDYKFSKKDQTSVLSRQ